MMRKTIALLLVLSLVVVLCACSAKDGTSLPDHPGDSYLGGDLAENESTSAEAESSTAEPQQTETTQAPSETEDASVEALRGEIKQAGAVFGVAYLGSYFNGSTSYAEWFTAAAGGLIDSYPFVFEIDAAHTIGTEGHMYCILPGADVISLTADSMDGEVLYQSETNAPILLFCSRDGEGMIADTVVTFMTGSGKVYQWEPRLDSTFLPEPYLGNNTELLSWDFTPTPDMSFSLEDWYIDGWCGPTKAGLAGADTFDGMTWCVTAWDSNATYQLHFYLNGSSSYDGEVVLECFYGDDMEVQANWQGWWRMETTENRSSTLSLDMMLMYGKDQDAFTDASVISETFDVLIHPSGSYLLLAAANGATLLPFFPEGTPTMELTLLEN